MASDVMEEELCSERPQGCSRSAQWLLPVTDEFESKEFHCGAGAEFVGTVVADLDDIFGFVSAEELRCGRFRLPTILFDGADGIVMYKVLRHQFAGDVVEGDLLFLSVKTKPIAPGAFFFFRARSVL